MEKINNYHNHKHCYTYSEYHIQYIVGNPKRYIVILVDIIVLGQ